LFLLSKTSTQVNTLEREVRELREERESAKAEARRLEAEVGEKKKKKKNCYFKIKKLIY
jgi:uncharacterized coiled-coil DUF342 family protein